VFVIYIYIYEGGDGKGVAKCISGLCIEVGGSMQVVDINWPSHSWSGAC
jgi:hypothetical protein